MSPIDDELRTALQRRAGAVAPAPDPLAGIERRAGRMRRNRLAASVAGSVLAVAAVATAVPLLTGPTAPDGPLVVATRPPATPTPAGTASAYALDPAAPWAYRGTPLEELGPGFLDTVTREYATRRGVAEDALTLTPLWGQGYDSSLPELAFVATVDGADRWGIVETGHAGPEFPVDEPVPSPADALAAVLPPDDENEVPRLVVLAAPEVVRLEYSRDRTSTYVQMAEFAPGVGAVQLVGDTTTATFRVIDPDDVTLLRADVPEVPEFDAGGPETPGPGSALPPPTNVVDWPLRGAIPDELLREAKAEVAELADVPTEQVAARRLFGAERDGRFYGLVQVWFGGDAQMFAWVRDLDDGRTSSQLLMPTAPGPAAVAVQFDDVVMVVPEPRTGQVLYAPAGGGEPAPVPDQGTEAAVLVERPSAAPDDRLLILDGDGDPERPIYRGTVDELLAASAS